VAETDRIYTALWEAQSRERTQAAPKAQTGSESRTEVNAPKPLPKPQDPATRQLDAVELARLSPEDQIAAHKSGRTRQMKANPGWVSPSRLVEERMAEQNAAELDAYAAEVMAEQQREAHQRYEATVEDWKANRQRLGLSAIEIPSQLSREDLKEMSPDQINEARAQGRLNAIQGLPLEGQLSTLAAQRDADVLDRINKANESMQRGDRRAVLDHLNGVSDADIAHAEGNNERTQQITQTRKAEHAQRFGEAGRNAAPTIAPLAE
jgi:hypothetical protein